MVFHCDLGSLFLRSIFAVKGSEEICASPHRSLTPHIEFAVAKATAGPESSTE